MFDEKSCKWIQIYKVLTVIIFLVIIAFGIIAGFGDGTTLFLDEDPWPGNDGILDDYFELGDFIIWILASGIVGFIQLVSNMLVIQFLNNVQIIREKVEKN